MAGGTQNRNAKKAFDIQNKYLGLSKACSCPIHRKKGIPTLVGSELFNGQGNGLQSMCRTGKRLLDSYKHKMNSWKLLFIFDKLTNTSNMELIKNNFKNSNSFLFYDRFIEISNECLSKITSKELSYKFFEFITLFDQIVGNRKNSLLVRMNIYDSNLSEKEFEEVIEDADLNNSLEKETLRLVIELHDKFCDELNLFSIESSNKSLKHHSVFKTTLSKIRELYHEDGSPFIINKMHVRGHKFNTASKTSIDNRVERYFSDGDYKEANKKVNEINLKNLSADHIWPISLGGKHDISNLEEMSLINNIKKRNNISIELVERVKLNPDLFISKRYINIFNNICNSKITSSTVSLLVRALQNEISIWLDNLKELSTDKKELFVNNFLIEHNMSLLKKDSLINDYLK